jgi:O-antigen/teichoic acid export membrane protein
MRKFIAKHTEFIENVAIMISGKTLASAIGFFALPIVARLFSPSDFGVAAIFVSATGIVSSTASLRYGAALVLPRENFEALTLMAFTYRILFFVCVVLLMLIGAYEATGLKWAPLEMLGYWLWLLPLAVFFSNSIGIQENWLTRVKAFKITTASLAVGNIITSGARIAIGAISGSSVYGLITGYFFGLIVRTIMQQALSKIGWRNAFQSIDRETFRNIARQYSDFPKLNAPAGLLFSLGQQIPVIFLGVIFSPAIAGFYAMADRIFSIPLSIVATSMRQVFLQRAASVVRRNTNLRKAFLFTTCGLALLGALPFAGFWLFGQVLLTWALGDQWSEAGTYVEILSPWLFIVWVAVPCHPVLIVLRQQQYWLYLQLTMTALRLGSFGVAYMISAGPLWTLKAFVVVNVVGEVALILTVIFIISKSGPTSSNNVNDGALKRTSTILR